MSITSKSAIKSLCLVSHLVANVITVKGIYAHCENGGGWILGHLVDGTQAEYVKVPLQIILYIMLLLLYLMKHS